MLLLSIMEVFFYSLNEAVSHKLVIADIGGSMVIHVFGAFFGLAASAVLTPAAARGNKDNAAVYHSDIFSMIGTVFLWIFWPSFNGATSEGNAQHRAVVNTVLSLTSSVVFAFVFSQFWRKERLFCMVDIQNATLAGGVAMGSVADMAIHPAFALLIGAIAGTVSVFGFSILQRFVENHLRIHDTCGVLNLHGIPGLIGGISSIIASAAATGDTYNNTQLLFIWPDRNTRNASHQAKLQLAFLVITLGISIISGLFCGILLSRMAYPKKFFLDSSSWETPSRELPYFFDVRGEAKHSSEKVTAARAPGDSTQLVPSPSVDLSQLSDLQSRLASLENTVRVQRKQIRDQNRSLANLKGESSISFRDSSEESALLSPSVRSRPRESNQSALEGMIENLSQKVNMLVENQKNR